MDTIILIKSIGIFITFITAVVFMMTRKVPTIIALPAMAIIFGLIAGVPLITSNPNESSIAQTILADGAMRLSSAIAGLVFGAWFGRVLNKVGITKGLIRKAAELGGDKPVLISIVFFVAASVIFSAANGLGMVILIGTIIVPIMITAGISPFVAGLVLLLANGAGAVFNVSGWAVYKDVLGLDITTIAKYTYVSAVPFLLISVLMIIFFIKREGNGRKAWAMPQANSVDNKKVKTIAYISPIVPVLLVFIFKIDIVPAVIVGALVALILTTPKRPVHVLSASLVEGIQDVAGAMGLMIGIGILLNCVMSPQVSAVISPIIEMVIPKSLIGYIIFFTVLSPLAIYRGPLNMWGLGSGVAALFVASGMNPVVAMISLRSVSNLQAVCDPTNSHNVWVADFAKVEINEYLTKTIAWIMVSILISMAIGIPMVLN